jgi:hypothetical protein
MKKVLLVVIMFLLFAGVVTASSINGDYNGKPIVKMKSNGQVLAVEDAPAVIMDSRTMVPIYMLRQIGLGVEWNAEEYSVDVTLPKAPAQNDQLSSISQYVEGIKKEITGEGVNITHYSINIDETGLFAHAIYDNTGLTTEQLIDDIVVISSGIYNFDQPIDGTIIEINNGTNTGTIGVGHQDMVDYFDGKITLDEFGSRWNIEMPEPISYTPPTIVEPTPIVVPETSSVIKSKIESDFDGFNYGNIYELTNGQYWKQVDYTYKYSYKYRPDVMIYKDGLYYYMNVEGIDKDPKVELIN